MKLEKTLMAMMCLGVLLLTSCKKQQQSMHADDYKTITVSKSCCTLNREFSATLEGEQAVEIRPQISGTITRICVEEGARVTKGQVLFVIDQVAYKAALETAIAQVNSAKASLANAELTLNSKQQLFNQHVVSDYDLNQAKNNCNEAKASLANARAQQLSAANNLSYTVVRSPDNGVIGMIPYRVGALVNSSITNPLTTVSNNTNVRAYFSVTESYLQEMIDNYGSTAAAIKMLPSVKLKTVTGKMYSQQARIDAISGNVDKATGTVSIRATFKNPNGELRNGGNGIIVMPYTIKDKIIIPQEATFDLQDKIFVYKIVNGQTQSTEIKVFDNNDGKNYVVQEGLNEGDRIIAEGAGLLRDGIKVK